MLPARLRLIRLVSASLIVLLLPASPILVMGCLEVGAFVPIVAELVAVVTIYLAEVSPVACMATPRPAIPLDELGVGAGDVVGVDLGYHPPNVCKVAILPLKVRLADPVVFWWKALQNDNLVQRSEGPSLGVTGCGTGLS